MCEGAVLKIESLPFDFYFDHGHSLPPFDLATVEKNHIRKLLLYTKGNKAETARLLNIGLTTLYRKIEEYHLG
jgi:DNA-binding NtrC family response regulator